MATATSKYNIVNKLFGMKEGSTILSAAKAVYGGNTFSNRIYKGNEIIYDVWEAVLSADNFTMPAKGGEIAEYLAVVSKMSNIDGTNIDLDYSFNVSTISPNTSLNSKTHNIIINQTDSNGTVMNTITVVCTQESNAQIGIGYGVPEVISTSISNIDAGGGSTMLTVKYSQTKTTYQSSGNNIVETLTGTTTATSLIGNSLISGAEIDGAYVNMISAGTTPYNTARNIYTITGYTFEVNGKTKTVTNASIAVKQEANIVENYSYSDYTLNLTSDVTSVNPISNPNVYITVESYRIKTPIYTSGEYGSDTKEGLNATLSTSYGSLSKTSVSNGDTVQFIPSENTGNNDRTITVNGKLTDYTSVTNSISFTQVAAIYEFKVSPLSATFDYSGGTKEFIAITTRNENVTNKPTVTSSNSAFTVESITLNDVLMDRYNIVIRASLNGSSTARYGTISVTQPGSGEVQEISVSQAAKPSSGGGEGSTSNVTANVEEAYWQNGTTIYYNVSFEGIDTYLDSVTIELNDDAYGGGTIYASTSHETILPNENVTGTLNMYDTVAPLYIVVKDSSGEVIGSGVIE